MRAAAIFGPEFSPKTLQAFQTDNRIEWQIGLPSVSDQGDIILLFGGDGTVHCHLSELVKLLLPVLVIPTGSGNDFARALGLLHIGDALVAWRRFLIGRANIRNIDLGVITALCDRPGDATPPSGKDSHYFCSVAGIGLDGEVARRANRLPRWLRGRGGYALAALSAIFPFEPLPITISRIESDGKWTTLGERPTTLAAFGNTAIYGGGMKIAPLARMDDGKLDVCVIDAIRPWKLACAFPTVYFGRHLRLREVDYFKTARVRVECVTPLDVFADGEYVCRTPVEIGVEPGTLKVLMP
jgi:diacylglycerol kinase (ATP)